MMELVEITCDRCAGEGFEDVEDGTLACVWCGYRVAAPKTRRTPTKHEGDRGSFRFKFGRHAGKTVADVDAEPNGRRYLEWIAKTNAALREIVTEYLRDTAAPPCASGAASQDAAASAAQPSRGEYPRQSRPPESSGGP